MIRDLTQSLIDTARRIHEGEKEDMMKYETPKDDTGHTHYVHKGGTETSSGGDDKHVHKIKDGKIQEAGGHTHKMPPDLSEETLDESAKVQKLKKDLRNAKLKLSKVKGNSPGDQGRKAAMQDDIDRIKKDLAKAGQTTDQIGEAEGNAKRPQDDVEDGEKKPKKLKSVKVDESLVLAKLWQRGKGVAKGNITFERGQDGVHIIKKRGKKIGSFSLDDEGSMWVANIDGKRGQIVGREIDDLMKQMTESIIDEAEKGRLDKIKTLTKALKKTTDPKLKKSIHAALQKILKEDEKEDDENADELDRDVSTNDKKQRVRKIVDEALNDKAKKILAQIKKAKTPQDKLKLAGAASAAGVPDKQLAKLLHEAKVNAMFENMLFELVNEKKAVSLLKNLKFKQQKTKILGGGSETTWIKKGKKNDVKVRFDVQKGFYQITVGPKSWSGGHDDDFAQTITKAINLSENISNKELTEESKLGSFVYKRKGPFIAGHEKDKDRLVIAMLRPVPRGLSVISKVMKALNIEYTQNKAEVMLSGNANENIDKLTQVFQINWKKQ